MFGISRKTSKRRLDERATAILDATDEPAYPAADLNHATWQLCKRVLNHMPASDRAATEGISSRQLNRLRSGTTTAPEQLRQTVTEAVTDWARQRLGHNTPTPPNYSNSTLALFLTSVPPEDPTPQTMKTARLR